MHACIALIQIAKYVCFNMSACDNKIIQALNFVCTLTINFCGFSLFTITIFLHLMIELHDILDKSTKYSENVFKICQVQKKLSRFKQTDMASKNCFKIISMSHDYIQNNKMFRQWDFHAHTSMTLFLQRKA